MKKLFLFFLFINLSTIGFAQMIPVWAKSIGGPLYDWSNSMTTDKRGNIYIAGDFRDTADLDPGTNTLGFAATGYRELFVEKLDNGGNLIWVKQIHGTSNARGDMWGIAVDPDENVYITGFFEFTIDFDPGPATFFLTGTDRNSFVCKLDPAGNFIWAKQIAGSVSQSTSIAVGSSGAVYISGSFNGSCDFDPGLGYYPITTAGVDAFVLKLDASGNFRWAQNFGPDGRGKSMILDAMENVLLYGEFRGTIDFDKSSAVYNLTIPPVGYYSDFIYKADSAGNFIMAEKVIYNSAWFAPNIALDVNGNIYVTGMFTGTEDFDPGPGVFTMNAGGYGHMYVYKLDMNGNFIWARQTQSPGWNHTIGQSIVVDQLGNAYITGSYNFSADLDPGINVYPVISEGLFDVQIVKLDALGNFICAQSFGGHGNEYGYDMALDNSGNLVIVGSFDHEWISPIHLESNGYDDIFIVKYEPCNMVTEITDPQKQTEFTLFPNPSQGQFHLSLPEDFRNARICIYNVLGELIYSVENTNRETEINLNDQPKGIYTIDVSAGNSKMKRKLIID